MRRAVVMAVALTACGRVGFTTLDDGGSSLDGGADGPGDDGPGCQLGDWPTTMVPLANVNAIGADDWDLAISPDERTIVFGSFRNGAADSTLYVATRAARDQDFSTPVLAPGFGAMAGEDVFGPAWSIDGTKLYFTSNGPKVVDYLGGGQFGTPKVADTPGNSPVFVSPDEVYVTFNPLFSDYDLERYTFDGLVWVKQPLPAVYARRGTNLSDGWPALDRQRRELYFETEVSGQSLIARVALDPQGGVPATFETLDALGNDFSDPDLSADGRRMYVGSRRRAGTDNDIYMFERACQ